MAHAEAHRTDTIGWLRAAVLGANDGLISTSSLVVGVAAAATTRSGSHRASTESDPPLCRWYGSSGRAAPRTTSTSEARTRSTTSR